METMIQDTLNHWQEEGSQLIQENFKVFRGLVTQVKNYEQLGKYDAAAVYGEIAAIYANFRHCGFYASPELEQLIIKIGRIAIPEHSYPRKKQVLFETPKKILHVATSVEPVGGHSKMLWRWIQQDTDRSHSLVLTRQSQKIKEPKILRDAVINSGGNIYKLNGTIGGIIAWATRLREIAASADIVVLHVYNHDVIPILAFANKEQCPPVIFLNHADHTFWLGSGITDVVANLRESGMCLSEKRRGIERERNLLLPTIVEPVNRVLSRLQAKRLLGLPENSIVLLSIARALKYKTIDGISYADAHVPLLKKYKQAVLIVIGSGNREDWSTAIEQTQGRIIVHPQREDTAIFYQAADIYVDSFPFVSITSLLEAGSYGVPLVSRYPYFSDDSNILGADMPGLTGNLIRVRKLEEYTAVLSHLIEDEEFRLKLGERTREKILEIHTQSNWQRCLNDVYRLAVTLPKIIAPPTSSDRMFLGEPDIYMPRIHGMALDLELLIKHHLTIMPVEQRLYNWLRLVKKPSFYNQGDRFSPFKYLLPEWLLCRVRHNLLDLKSFLQEY